MANSPILGAPQLVEGQALPATTVNEQQRYAEQGANYFVVLDQDLTAPPGSPADGDAYIVAASATGAWAGRDGLIAFRMSTGWLFVTPREGTAALVVDEAARYLYSSGAWAVDSTGGGSFSGAADTDIWAGTSTTKTVTPKSLADAAVPQVLTDGATTTWDMADGYNAEWTLGGDHTLAVSNPITGFTYSLAVIQDGTGTRLVTWPGSFDWGDAGAPTLTITASKRDRITLFCTDAATPKFDAFLSGTGFA